MEQNTSRKNAGWYQLEINGVDVTVYSETGMMKAGELLESARGANALVTVLDEKTVLADDDRIYKVDEEVDIMQSKTFIAVDEYKGKETFIERIRHLLPGDSVYNRR